MTLIEFPAPDLALIFVEAMDMQLFLTFKGIKTRFDGSNILMHRE